MTTIVSNGYYLASDHRVTTSSKEISYVSPQTGYDQRSYHYDHFLKIRVLERPVPVRSRNDVGSIEAFAVCGVAKLLSCFEEIMHSSQEFEWSRWRKTFRAIGDSDTHIVCVTDKAFTITINVNGFRGPTTQVISQPGRLRVAGTGSKLIIHADSDYRSSDTPIDEIMAIASMVDPATSSSYSAYGVREKEFFTDIRPSDEQVRQKALSLWNRLGQKFAPVQPL